MEMHGDRMGEGAAGIEVPSGHSEKVLRDNSLGGSGVCEGSEFYTLKQIQASPHTPKYWVARVEGVRESQTICKHHLFKFLV